MSTHDYPEPTAGVARYTTKPVTIEATVPWSGLPGDATPILDWVLQNGGTATYECLDEVCLGDAGKHIIKVHTLEGVMDCPPGWRIIRGLKGEFYPCEEDVFQMKYAPAGEGVTSVTLHAGGSAEEQLEAVFRYLQTRRLSAGKED